MSKDGCFFVRSIFFRVENFDGFVKVGDGTLSLLYCSYRKQSPVDYKLKRLYAFWNWINRRVGLNPI